MKDHIRIPCSFLTDPRRRILIERVGRDATYHLMCLWIQAAVNKPDGVFNGSWSAECIELAIDWEGESGKLVAELVNTGF